MICQVGERNTSHHQDVKQNAVSHTESNRKEIMKAGLDTLATHPPFEQNSLNDSNTARSSWHISVWLPYMLI